MKLVPEAYSPADLNHFSFSGFLKQLKLRKDKAPVKASSLRTYHTNLLIFVHFLERNGYLAKGEITDSIVRPPHTKYNDSRALAKEETSSLISAIMLHTIDDEFLYIRDLTILYLLLYTGIRKGELLGLRVKDIDFGSKTLFVNHETSKSRNSRYIPLNPMLESQLRTYFQMLKDRNIQTEVLIISKRNFAPITEHGLKHYVERYSKKSGVKFHLHRCRHTFACCLSRSNTNTLAIRNLMGHANISTTERYLRSIQTESSRAQISELSF